VAIAAGRVMGTAVLFFFPSRGHDCGAAIAWRPSAAAIMRGWLRFTILFADRIRTPSTAAQMVDGERRRSRTHKGVSEADAATSCSRRLQMARAIASRQRRSVGDRRALAVLGTN